MPFNFATPLSLALFGAALGAACQSTPEADPPPPETAPQDLGWSCSPRVELSSLWEHLSIKYDSDGDGRVTAGEYTRGEVRFANYDRNEDGVLEEADFPTDTYFNGFNHMLLEDADADGDGELTPDEWWAFCGELDANGDGRVERDEAAVVMGGWTSDWRLFLLSFDQDSDGDFDEVDLELTFLDQDYNGDGILTGKEMSGWVRTAERSDDDPPAAGEAAPDFELPFADDPSRSFRLLENRAGRPVALVFGSYT